MSAKRANNAEVCESSELIVSSIVESSSVKVRSRVRRVREAGVRAIRLDRAMSRSVGCEPGVFGSESMPSVAKMECRLCSAEDTGDEGVEVSCASSRFAHSITRMMLSTSPSTAAKKSVSSCARPFRLSERLSSSDTMIGEEVMFAARIDSPRSHTAVPVSCSSSMRAMPFSL